MESESPNISSDPSTQHQLLILVIIMVAGFILGTMMQFAYFILAGQDILALGSATLTAADTRWSLLISQVFIFLVPALLFSWLMFKRRIWSHLRLLHFPSLRQIVLVFLVMLFVIPLIQASYELNQALPLPDWMLTLEESTADTLEQILEMDTIWLLILNVFLMAVIPAVGEELVFRGIIQQMGYRIFNRSPWISIWVTAFIFSAIHFQFAGFIPRLILGVLLGYLFYWSKNLFIPIAAHFFNNGISVVSAYFYPEMISEIDKAPVPDMPWYATVFTIVILVPIIQNFRKTTPHSEKTESI